jgi:L-rhamnonate dehydratase
MFYGTVHIGRRGLLLHAISAVDNALWDALGRCRDEPVWQLLGPRRHDTLPCYATTHRPDIAKAIGYVGGKLPMPCGYAEGESGVASNLALAAEMRDRCGESSDFFLAVDCYMSLDVPTAIALANGLAELDYAWVEEALPPDDYWGYAEVRREVAGRIAIATGEHEDTRWGFRLLLDHGCADVLQPDVNWCGGLSELVKIAELADAHGTRVVQHAPGTVGVHFAVGRDRPEPVEFLIDDHKAPDQPATTTYLGDLWPEKGQIRPTDLPGFGRALDPAVPLRRPYSH